MKKLNIKIYRIVKDEYGILRIELGKYWEIRITRELMEKEGYHGPYGPPYGRENKGFTRHIKNGHIIPSWYGFSYHDFDTDTYSYMPIPINLIYAVLRWAKYKLLYRIRIEWPHHLMSWEKRIYRLGQIDGYNAGRFNKDMVEGDSHRMLEGVDPKTNPGWNKYKI